MGINRQHKDRPFKFIFQEKENLLQLYNALNGTNYDNPEELEIVTLEDVIYMYMKNDISFILDYGLNLFEHQSTENNNMPLRGFLYFARQYEKYVNERKFNLYGKKKIMLPTPQYVVFYNGTEWQGERKILKLSDSFANSQVKPCMELEAIQLNINYGHNNEIMEKCKILWEYAVFIGKVRTYSENMNIEAAIDKAVNECIEQGILREILISHRAEVKNMLLTEYDEETTRRMFRMEYEEEIEQIQREKEQMQQEMEQMRQKMEKLMSHQTQEKNTLLIEYDEEKIAQAKEENEQLRRENEDLKAQLKEALNKERIHLLFHVELHASLVFRPYITKNYKK